MIGIGCGIATDHFARSGVIGNGARPICGIPASLATLDTAMVDGVMDEPMMMSALDSGTKSSALRSGMPSAAAGPVVVTVMPMVISLVCAIAGSPGSARDAVNAAADR